MGLGRAIVYIFDDRDWLHKIAIVCLLSAFSLVPLVGLVGLAALLGYLLVIIRNVKQRQPLLLPVWGNFERYIGDGAVMLFALCVYNLPILLMGGFLIAFPQFFAGNVFASGGAALLGLCCLVPIILIYTLAAWTMLAVATVRFATTQDARAYLQVNQLIRDVQTHSAATVQWLILVLLLNMILALLMLIPLAGWLVVLAFTIPVHGHLLGQYALRLNFPQPPTAAPRGRAQPPAGNVRR